MALLWNGEVQMSWCGRCLFSCDVFCLLSLPSLSSFWAGAVAYWHYCSYVVELLWSGYFWGRGQEAKKSQWMQQSNKPQWNLSAAMNLRSQEAKKKKFRSLNLPLSILLQQFGPRISNFHAICRCFDIWKLTSLNCGKNWSNFRFCNSWALLSMCFFMGRCSASDNKIMCSVGIALSLFIGGWCCSLSFFGIFFALFFLSYCY